jgi:hypothetical protein
VCRDSLFQTCMRLKKELGKPEDFSYPDIQIKESAKGEVGRLEGIIRGLEREVADLEQERLRHLRALRDNAAQISEKGIKFLGLTPDQVVQLNDFARNLRDGVVELPLNDRSRELSQQVKELQAQADIYRVKIERLQHEVTYFQVEAPKISKETQRAARDDSEDMRHLKEGMTALLTENRSLKAKMDELQAELPKAFLEQPQAQARRSSVPRIEMAKYEEVMTEKKELAHQVKGLEGQVMELRAKLRAAEMVAQSVAEQADTQVAEQMDAVMKVMGEIAETQHQLQEQVKERNRVQQRQLTAFASRRSTIEPKSPRSEYGRELLGKLLTQLNLPPEEWADDVKELSSQLVEALEELSDREQELEEHEELLRRYEGHLALMRQQMAKLYQEHLDHASKAHDTEERLQKEVDELRSQRISLQIKVKKLEDLAALEELCEQHPAELHQAAKDMSRKLMVHEVNEAVLTKKYSLLTEQLKRETAAKARLEHDVIEVEAVAKRRIAWLEEWKLGASQRLEDLHAQLDRSVPRAEFECIFKELETLREDYVDLLQREADARIKILRHKEPPELAKAQQAQIFELQVALTKAEEAVKVSKAEIENQRRLTDLAVDDLATSGESGTQLVSEVAHARGEAARLEVELAASRKRSTLLASRLAETEGRLAQLEKKHSVLEAKERDANTVAQKAKRDLLDMEANYAGGLTTEEAQQLLERAEAAKAECEGHKREATRYCELADILSAQTISLSSLRKDREDEIADLRRHCAELESRSDDDLIIGKLHRTLLATKASYRAFARKHEIARANLRRKEAMVKALEMRLDEREEALHRLHEDSRAQVAVLRRALQQVSVLGVAPEGLVKRDDIAVSIFQRAKALSDRVLELAELADQRERDSKAGEDAARRLQETVEALQAEKHALLEQVQDLRLISRLQGEPESLERELGRRLLTVSEDLKSTKLALMHARRQNNTLRDDKRHLDAVVAKQQDMLALMEEERLDRDTRAMGLPEVASRLSAGPNAPGSLLDLIFTPRADFLPFPPRTSGMFNAGPGLGPDAESQLVDVDQVLNDLESTQGTAASLRQQLNQARADKQEVLARLDAVSAMLADYENAVAFYEKQALQENLPTMKVGSTRGATFGSPDKHRGGAAGIHREEEQQLQEVANTTINSLKALIEEKNRMIERYERRLADAKLLSRQDSAINKAEIDRLTEKLFRKNEDAISQLKHAVYSLSKTELTESGAHLSRRLMEQVEDATGIIAEKDEEVRQLELKLRTAHNQRERAEERCGAALAENEKIKQDLITLARQLQDAEERVLDALKGKGGPTGTKTQVAELRAALSSKEEKLRGLRLAIVRLKEEFIRAEEKHTREHEKRDMDKENHAASHNAEMDEQVRSLRKQIETLQAGFAQAKADIEAARKAKDKMSRAKELLEEDNERLSQRIVEIEANSARVEDDLTRMRGQLNEALRKEQRMKDRLDEVRARSAESKEGDVTGELQRKVQVLTAQNAALRSALDSAPPGTSARIRPPGAEEAVGSPASTAGGRDSKRNAWETEKKLRRRIEVRYVSQSVELTLANRGSCHSLCCPGPGEAP